MMFKEHFKKQTPCFLIDINRIKNNINNYNNRKFHLNYSVKSCLFEGLVKNIDHSLDGFTVSSKRDLRKVRNETEKPIHFVSPLVREIEIKEMNSMGNSITFNSIGQFDRLKGSLSSSIKTFIRINPEKSFVKKDIYDPCKLDSQLGITISLFKEHLKNNSVKAYGIHFHNNYQSDHPEQVMETMNHIETCLGDYLHQFNCINMGGGYLYSKKLINIFNHFSNEWHKKYGVMMMVEPGFDISSSAGFLVSSVVDIFNRQNKNIAILDTTVNHLPEVFECQSKPDVLNHVKSGYNYVLCGCTCLPGDAFGEHYFDKPLKIGDTIVFKNVGAYSYVRANEFNGIEKPNLIAENNIVF